MPENALPENTAPLAISAVGLRKSYGDNVVLDGVDLEVPRGTVLALLGPNGAGKSTTVGILATLVRPDAGSVTVAGHDLATDPDGLRRSIGLTGQYSAYDGLLTGRENLRLIADLHHLGRRDSARRIDDLVDLFDLRDALDRPAATWSGGMRRKLDLALTLVGRPAVVFLDEPTTGLDPRSRRGLWDVVNSLVADGVTILLTTQYLDEADRLADAVAVLDGGRVVARGTPAQLKREVPGGALRLRLADPHRMHDAAEVVRSSGWQPQPDAEDGVLTVPRGGEVETVRELLARLDAAGIGLDSIEVSGPDLDDVFLSLTAGHQQRSAS